MSSSFRSDRIMRHQTRQQAPSRFVSFFLGGVALLLVFLYFFVKSTGNIEITPKSYQIDKGASVSVLANKLKWDVSSWRYSAWIRFFAPKDISLNAGSYEAPRGTTIETFLTEVVKKPVYSDLTITILPGWNMYDIDTYLAEKNIAKYGEFLRVASDRYTEYAGKYDFLKGHDSLEGFLFPDTYRIRKDATAHDVILILLAEFDKKIGDDYRALGATAYQKLILASIVEREERKDASQPIVAGILEKRVREGIPMGADATVCVGYGKTQKECTPNFIASVIQDKNPFNTRNQQGYTPTPISSVPLSAWRAAMHPESSPYYYYLHGSDGTIHYGKTLTEHNANKQKYLQ